MAPHRISLRLGARASRPHPVPAKASSRARACGLSTLQAAGSVRRLAAAELQCDSAGSHLAAGAASARRKGSNGPVPGRSKWGRQPKLCQAWCGRDARAPRKPSFHDIATPKGQKRRRILAPLVVEGGPSVFRSIGVYSCPFVVRLHFQVGFLRSRRPDIPPHPVPAKASSRARACGLSTDQPGGRGAMAPFPVDRSGGDSRSCARPGAGGTPALPGSLYSMRSLHQRDKSADAFWRRLSSKEVRPSSGLLVFIRVHSWFVFIFRSAF